jgi:hypothetical protein
LILIIEWSPELDTCIRLLAYWIRSPGSCKGCPVRIMRLNMSISFSERIPLEGSRNLGAGANSLTFSSICPACFRGGLFQFRPSQSPVELLRGCGRLDLQRVKIDSFDLVERAVGPHLFENAVKGLA